jgi:methylmalonyl-CoA mutase cobalamin-binding domain/chain
MRPARTLLAEGRAAAPPLGRTGFCMAHGVRSEAEYKLRRRDAGRLSYHAHLGLSDWPATAGALREVVAGLAEHGETLDRFGLCLSRSMSLPAAKRSHVAKETGPRLEAGDWEAVAAAPVQAHLGDFMIGTPAGLENTVHALAAGITTIGNLGQHFAFEPPGGHDDVELTETTLKALGAMAAHRERGALVHSYLDDGPAMQFRHYGGYLGWAALELYVVETLIRARLAHCYGGLVPDPRHRAIVGLALDELRDRDSLGSMVYGNTVEYGRERDRNVAVLETSVRVDVATQLHRATGHAITPVPLSEAERIPHAAEILEVQLIARGLEREVRAGGAMLDWAWVERRASEGAQYARAFRDGVLDALRDSGVDVTDAAELLLALRRSAPSELEARVRVPAPRELRALETWKHGAVAGIADRTRSSLPRLDGLRVLLATLEVHDVVRDALARELPAAGCQVIVLPSSVSVAQVAQAAADEDADVVILGTYNGGALTLGAELTRALAAAGTQAAVVFGGVLNQDDGGPLPVDARAGLGALGIRCVDEIEQLGPALAGVRRLSARAIPARDGAPAQASMSPRRMA